MNELDEETGRFRRWERESTFGFTGAITTALTDRIFLGAEVQHPRKFEGSFLNRDEGCAIYIGPTLSARLAPSALIQAA